MSIFFNLDKIRSYNALYNFLHGARGVGKTFSCKNLGISDFKKNGSQFIYLRRHETELSPAILEEFFLDIQGLNYPNDDLKVNGKKFYINGDVAGYALALSTAGALKGMSFPHVNLIIYDEYCLDGLGYHRYLRDEVDMFFNFYETVARFRDVYVYFLANNSTLVNPYLIDERFDLRIPEKGTEFYRNKNHGEAVIQLIDNPEYSLARKSTRSGKVMASGKFGRYMYDNDVLLDSKTFIEKKKGSLRYLFTFTFMNKSFGIWRNDDNGLDYVSSDTDPSCQTNFALTMDDHTTNTRLVRSANYSMIFTSFVNSYKRGKARFEDQMVKQITFYAIKLALRC